eukprot:gnl/TRDRNA2_/TRDRNA2_161261_c0_seq1.p1 gnl/TRDRNA2_/TRDRNA2_161261_c0~~gnl/TRDRNA2_/TRDRNA2_161261_c0_seq1.p1  ORF type:complete len:294 (+),score=69.49 gnl/TRDRNA2_/TRDRNA2_161261_c0_seq1:85-966(+)
MGLPLLLSAAVSFAVAKLANRLSATTVEKVGLDATLVRFACSVMQLLGGFCVVLGVGRLLGVQSDNLWSSLISSSSIVIGLAAQDTTSNLVGGLLLLLTRPFEVGDQISIAGSTGVVSSIQFFHSILVTANNEAVILPNSCVIDNTCQNNSNNYGEDMQVPNLREIDIDITLSGQADLEAGISALQKAAKKIDELVSRLNTLQTEKDFANGRHTIAKYHELKYGTDLKAETKANPTYVFVGGSGEHGGHHLQVRAFADNVLYWDVFQAGYRMCIKALKEANIEVFDDEHSYED